MADIDRYRDSRGTSAFGYGLHHVQIPVPPGSEDRCRAFYVDVLGMTEVEKPPELAKRGGLWLRTDGLEIHLGIEEGCSPSKKAHPGILAAGLDALAERLEQSGHAVEWDEDFIGFRRFHTRDPLGNRLEFMAAVDE
ncbi:glyoxalase [Glycomyces sp. L485]|uniref:VOC family protein n=1 Tax=Glycomyces sp. L485 TaxID=2909235 RepID=UPI001F4B70E4|nr:VOC family protein [Glycomyces sp. L485]MCH7230213.1 glyoxalase [Glycomyces sp. L485]